MRPKANLVAEKAEELVGTPFLLHGKNERFGLDCVGLTLLCLRSAGVLVPRVPSYQLRNLGAAQLLIGALPPSIVRLPGHEPAQRGDIIAVCPGPAQLHLVIAIASSEFVHAHAGLRKVARMAGTQSWAKIEHLRIIEE